MKFHPRFDQVLMIVFSVYIISGLGAIWWISHQPIKVNYPLGVKQQTLSFTPVQKQVKGLEVKPDLSVLTAEWQTYVNQPYGYSLKYPSNCVVGAMPDRCQSSNRQDPECLCSIDFTNPDQVVLQAPVYDYPTRSEER